MLRPGAIIGPQQFFLLDYEEYFRKEGESSPIRLRINQKIRLLAEQERESTKEKSKRNSSMRSRRASSVRHQKQNKPIDPL